jgi:hypothetical protein
VRVTAEAFSSSGTGGFMAVLVVSAPFWWRPSAAFEGGAEQAR